jgi:dynein heavy chain
MQEVERYNMLLAAISESLSSLQLGLKGLVVITPELESVLSALTNGIVPELWSKCYPSIKPLGTWVRDLLDRVEFFNEWIDLRLPAIFWLSAFTYPTGLTTGVLQTAARKNVVSVDSLSWDFVVLDGANVETALLATVRSHARRSTALDLRGDFTCPLLYLLSSSSSSSSSFTSQGGAPEGIYVHGMFLEGAKWDTSLHALGDARPMELSSLLPIVHFLPKESTGKAAKNTYECPLYLYPMRTGTRERPSYMLTITLPSGAHDEAYWVRRGTALLLSLSL